MINPQLIAMLRKVGPAAMQFLSSTGEQQMPQPRQNPAQNMMGSGAAGGPFSGDVRGEAMRRAQGFQQQMPQQQMGFSQALRKKGSNANILGSTAQGAMQGGAMGGVPGAIAGGALGFLTSGGGKKLAHGVKKIFNIF